MKLRVLGLLFATLALTHAHAASAQSAAPDTSTDPFLRLEVQHGARTMARRAVRRAGGAAVHRFALRRRRGIRTARSRVFICMDRHGLTTAR